MKTRRTSNIYLLLLLTIPINGFSQQFKGEAPRKPNNTYINLSLGKSVSSFRDFATSPLIYRGMPTFISLSRIKQKYNSQNTLGLSYSFGTYSTSVGSERASSSVKTTSGFYSRLYDLDKVRLGKWKTKVGGLINATTNIRINNSLQNNALGIDVFATAFGSVSFSRDVSRRKAKSKKFIFIPYQLKARRRTLDARFNIGLMNNTFRNGFAYIGQSGVLNESKIFDDYKFKVFSGMRFSTAVDYTIFLNNNALRLSYLWDAYKTGGSLDKFEMAQHTLGLSFLINTKTK